MSLSLLVHRVSTLPFYIVLVLKLHNDTKGALDKLILTSLTSPTSKFFVSGPGPLLSACGPVTGVHGVEIVPAVTTLPADKTKTLQT